MERNYASKINVSMRVTTVLPLYRIDGQGIDDSTHMNNIIAAENGVGYNKLYCVLLTS